MEKRLWWRWQNIQERKKKKKKKKPHTATGKVHSDLNNEMGDHVHGIPQKITVQNQLCSVTQNFHNNYNYDLL